MNTLSDIYWQYQQCWFTENKIAALYVEKFIIPKIEKKYKTKWKYGNLLSRLGPPSKYGTIYETIHKKYLIKIQYYTEAAKQEAVALKTFQKHPELKKYTPSFYDEYIIDVSSREKERQVRNGVSQKKSAKTKMSIIVMSKITTNNSNHEIMSMRQYLAKYKNIRKTDFKKFENILRLFMYESVPLGNAQSDNILLKVEKHTGKIKDIKMIDFGSVRFNLTKNGNPPAIPPLPKNLSSYNLDEQFKKMEKLHILNSESPLQNNSNINNEYKQYCKRRGIVFLGENKIPYTKAEKFINNIRSYVVENDNFLQFFERMKNN